MTQTTSTATTRSDQPVPVGAVRVEEWQPNGDGRFYRSFDSEERDIPSGARHSTGVSVFAAAVQWDDGHIEDGSSGDTFDSPRVYVAEILSDGLRREGIPLSVEAARHLADVLVTAADEAEGWATR